LLVSAFSYTAQATETTTYVLSDAQGTVLAREDAHGTTIARYDYRPYGKQQAGPSTAGPGYTGHVDDPDTGLVYMQARYYDPQAGRFLSVDPVTPKPGNIYNFNVFAYAWNDPVNHIDPTGRETGAVSYASTKSLTEAMADRNDPEEARTALIMAGVIYGGAAATVVGPEAAAGGLMRVYRAWRFKSRLQQVRKHLPGWKETPNKKGTGSRFEDPAAPKANRVRVDQGNPDHQLPSQRVDHVVEQRNGVTVDANGKPIEAPKPASTPDAHIPLKEWLNNRND
jgi:RHS repeat-associated protein